jgi:hypothetical protein
MLRLSGNAGFLGWGLQLGFHQTCHVHHSRSAKMICRLICAMPAQYKTTQSN